MTGHPLMQFFTYAHLRDEKLQAVSREYAALAQRTLELAPDNAQRDEALKKLLEAKDCAVRALLFKEPELNPCFKHPECRGAAACVVPAPKSPASQLSGLSEQFDSVPEGFTVRVAAFDASAQLHHRDDVPEPPPTAPG